ANGTSALFASLNALGVGPGDEVLVPPYTFVATINVVLLQHALPVFIDTDRQTSQMDAGKIEAAITPRTTCILPAHIGGNVADLNNGRGRKEDGFSYHGNGANLRMTEFQAALLLTQMARLEEQSRVREENAQYLTKQLEEIPGIAPARHYPGTTRNDYHLYMF